MTEDHNQPTSSLQEQLVALYADRERLELELGTAESEPILAHIRSLEERLRVAEHELREGEQAAGGTPSHHEAEMRLAEVVSERESFFENVASNNYDEVESTIEELKTQIEALEVAMAEAQQAEAEQAAAEQESMDDDLQPQLDFPAEELSEVQADSDIEPLLESDLEFADESLLQNELAVEADPELEVEPEAELDAEPELELELEAAAELQAELPPEEHAESEPMFSSTPAMQDSDPAMDDAMDILLNQSAELAEAGLEEPAEAVELAAGDELMAEFGIPSPSTPEPENESMELEGPLEMELEELPAEPELAADPIPEPLAALPETPEETEDASPDLADELAAEFGIEPVAPESFSSESRDFSSPASNDPSSGEPQPFGSFPSPTSSASQDTSSPIPQMATTSNEPAAPFGSQSQQTTSASSSSVATATEMGADAAPLPQSSDAPAAASEVQSFVSSLATLFAQTDFVFEGQTPNGRFRFVGKNG